MEQFQNLIEQLRHAVVRFNGRTTLTQEDIRILDTMYRELKRYDDMAARRYRP